MPHSACKMLVLIGVISLGLGGCGVQDSASGGKRTRSKVLDRAPVDDLQCAALLNQEGGRAEAKAWLRDDKHNILASGDRRPLLRHFEDLTWAGVREIYAMNQKPDETGRMTTSEFIAVMPEDKENRAKVVRLHNDFWKFLLKNRPEAESCFIKDQDQKYVYYDLDLAEQ